MRYVGYMTKMNNVYWPVYKRIENALVDLMGRVSFSDDQINVYSLLNAELLIRCAVEIEALSKKLYQRLGGAMSPVDENGNVRDLYFDTDCLAMLEKRWSLGSKQIQLVSPECYFEDESNIFITPLRKANKRGSSGSKWKQAYQSLKHNRAESIKDASIKNLIHALGALYILNLYYRDETIQVPRSHSAREFDGGMGSSIFSVGIFEAGHIRTSNGCITDGELPGIDTVNQFVCIRRLTEGSVAAIEDAMSYTHTELKKRLAKSQRVHDFLIANPGYKARTPLDLAEKVGGIAFVREVYSGLGISEALSAANYEIVLNKGGPIYRV